jgi:hypothetical protein
MPDENAMQQARELQSICFARNDALGEWRAVFENKRRPRFNKN